MAQPIKFRYYHGQTGPYRTIDLFLKNNLRITYTPISAYSFCDNRAGFVFLNCIVCGKNRPDVESYKRCPPMESPINCENPKCKEVTHNMQIEWGEDARRLFHAIWRQNTEIVNNYRVDKAPNF